MPSHFSMPMIWSLKYIKNNHDVSSGQDRMKIFRECLKGV